MKMSDRQREVMDLVAKGRQTKEIARDLGLSEGTVKVHLQYAMAKLGARNRTEAAVMWLCAA